ncbi:MAG: DUF2330 domain-containing protein [Sandaracinaceae bacterium]
MRPSTAALGLALLSLIVLATLPAPRGVSACASVSRDAPVQIVGEEALIVWDEETRTEHFIRHAGFHGATQDFGFLVPTPTRPQLGEVRADLFASLFDIYRRHEPAPRGRVRSAGAQSLGAGSFDSFVHVLEERRVAGLDAAVLAANDPSALAAWLAQHRYPSSEPLTRWMAPYLERGWMITAFRYPGATSGGDVASRAVRMTFTTEQPFFPYSEPVGPSQPRPFRVSVIAPYRVSARLGARRWSAPVGYAGQPNSARLEALLRDAVPARAVAGEPWLTVFHEDRSRRGRVDLTFERARSQRPVPSRLSHAIALHPTSRPRVRSESDISPP